MAACQDDPAPAAPVVPSTQLIQTSVPTGAMSPVRIAQGPSKILFVSDFRNRVVYELRAAKGAVTHKRTLAIPGSPLGVAWARQRLFVGNVTTHTVDVYRSTGKWEDVDGAQDRWLYTLGGPGTVTDPSDIATDAGANLVFVLDAQQRVVKVFDLLDGTLLRTISGPGSGSQLLQNVTGIAVDPMRQEVLVTDYGEPTQASTSPPAVKIFDYQGNFLSSISGRLGMLGQRFGRPQGPAVDGAGHIYLPDAVAGEVFVLDRTSGATLATIGSFGTGPGELWLPLDIVLDEDLDLFVTNNRPGRLEIFSVGGQLP